MYASLSTTQEGSQDKCDTTAENDALHTTLTQIIIHSGGGNYKFTSELQFSWVRKL